MSRKGRVNGMDSSVGKAGQWKGQVGRGKPVDEGDELVRGPSRSRGRVGREDPSPS